MSKTSQAAGREPVLVLVLKQHACLCLDGHRGWRPNHCNFLRPFYLRFHGALVTLQLPKPQQLNPDRDHKFPHNSLIVLALLVLVSSYCDILIHFRGPVISVIHAGGR